MVLQRLEELMGPNSQMRYATGRDSVDEMVTFEYYPMTNSTWQNEEVGTREWFLMMFGGFFENAYSIYIYMVTCFDSFDLYEEIEGV